MVSSLLLIKTNHDSQCPTRRVSSRESPSPTRSTKDLEKKLETLAKEHKK
jgi:hypothetical protein